MRLIAQAVRVVFMAAVFLVFFVLWYAVAMSGRR